MNKLVKFATGVFENIEEQVTSLTKSKAGAKVFRSGAIVMSTKGERKGQFAIATSDDPDRIHALVSLLSEPGSRFVCGLADIKHEKKGLRCMLDLRKSSKRSVKDIIAFTESLQAKEANAA